MVTWNFTVLAELTPQSPSEDWLGISIPSELYSWQGAYFSLLDDTLANRTNGATATLIETGCNSTDSTSLNCTQTCTDPTEMFRTVENLWNCITLSTVAKFIAVGNDTINSQDENRLDERFHFDSLQDFDGLDIFGSLRNCIWQSCSNSQFGSCSPSAFQYKCSGVQLDDLQPFGDMLRDDYCQDVDPGLDADIAGQGVLISYIIQSFLVLFLCFSSKLTSEGFVKIGMKTIWKYFRESKIISTMAGPFSFPQRSHAKQSAIKKYLSPLKFLCKLRKSFPKAVSESLADLQEAQMFFTATVGLATVITFEGYKGLANVFSIFSYIVNLQISQGLIVTGMYSLLMLQAVLQRLNHRADNPQRRRERPNDRVGYTLSVVILNWCFMISMEKERGINAESFLENLEDTSNVRSCGFHPGPMSYCEVSPRKQHRLTFFASQTVFRAFIHALMALLIIDWVLQFHHLGLPKWLGMLRLHKPQSRYFDPSSSRQSKTMSREPIDITYLIRRCILIFTEFVSFILIIFGLIDLFQIFFRLYKNTDGLTFWSFGQLVAVAIWLPVIFKFLYFLIFGVKYCNNDKQRTKTDSQTHRSYSENDQIFRNSVQHEGSRESNLQRLDLEHRTW